MKPGSPKSIPLVISFMLINCFGFGFSAFQDSYSPEAKIVYTDVTSYDDGFVAVTNNGRIDWISDNGTIKQTRSINGESFKNIVANKQQLIILTFNGQFILYEDSSSQKVENQSKNVINCFTIFKNRLIAGCNEGELLIGNNKNSLESLKLEVKGDIVSLSSNNNNCWGVTNSGEIINSNDGANWTVFDFNSVYKGYYKACNFIKVETTSNQIAVVGKSNDGSPVLFFSSKGNVWSERALNYSNDEGFNDSLKEIPSDICYDAANDQFVLMCTEGLLMTIPSCSHCQKVYQISVENTCAIAGNESKLLVVGNNNFVKIINANAL